MARVGYGGGMARAAYPDPVGESEFGGVSGMTQPLELGYVLSAAEKAMLARQVDPMDDQTQPLGGTGDRVV